MVRGPRRYEIDIGADCFYHARTKAEAFEIAEEQARRYARQEVSVYVFDTMAQVGKPDYWRVEPTGTAKVLKRRGIM